MIGAYESDPGLPHQAVLLMGPFMPAEQRLAFQARVARDRRLHAITFEARVEPLFERASAVVAMGGYNTFCEILSFGKPALLVPRTCPGWSSHPRRAGRTSWGWCACSPMTACATRSAMAARLARAARTGRRRPRHCRDGTAGRPASGSADLVAPLARRGAAAAELPRRRRA